MGIDYVINTEDSDYSDTTSILTTLTSDNHLAPNPMVSFSPTLLKRLQQYITHNDVDLCFISTWNDNNDIENLLQDISWTAPYTAPPFMGDRKSATLEAFTSWKAESIILDQSVDPAPFVWVDAYAVTHHRKQVVKQTQENCLFIEPNRFLGLTEKDLNRIDGFLLNQQIYGA